MTQLAAQLDTLTTEDTALREEYGALRAQIREECDARWNGCDNCDGRGWVVTWDTLDCVRGSYAQYGGCPNEACTKETREASGLKVRSSKYDRNRGTSVLPRGTDEQEARADEIIVVVAIFFPHKTIVIRIVDVPHVVPHAFHIVPVGTRLPVGKRAVGQEETTGHRRCQRGIDFGGEIQEVIAK